MLISPQRIVSLWEMISYLSGNTFAAVGNISQFSNMLHDVEPTGVNQVGIPDSQFITLHSSVKEVERIAVELGLDATIDIARDCIELMVRHEFTPSHYILSQADAERLCWSLGALVRCLTSQLQSRAVIVFDSRNSKFITSDDPPFGKCVDDAFPKASEEVSEGAKCLALQRNTACVFHLMRAMELSVARLAEAIPTGKPTDKEWGKILSDIGAAIEAMPRGAKRNQWSESHSHLYHVKQAWRNDTMHPKKTYTDEQAQAVFDAVRSFMVHLAPLVG